MGARVTSRTWANATQESSTGWDLPGWGHLRGRDPGDKQWVTS